jgi:O-antigen ligase
MRDERIREAVNRHLNYAVVLLAALLPVFRAGVSLMAPLVIVLWLIDWRWSARWQQMRRDGVLLALGLFLLLNIASLAWSHDVVAGLDYIDKYRYLLLVPAIATSLRVQFVKPAALAFCGGLAVSLIWSYGMHLGLVHFGEGYPYNPSPTMLHLDYSMFLAFAALLVLNIVVRHRMTLRDRLLWSAFGLWVTVGLFINIGRSGQVAFFATLLVMLLVYFKVRSVWKAAACAVVVALVLTAAYVTIPTFEGRVDALVQEVWQAARGVDYDTNQGKRIAAIIVATRIILNHPLLGTGVGDTMATFRLMLDTQYQYLKEPVYWFPHLHNQYLQVMTELGAVGMLLFLNIFYQLVRAPIRDEELRGVAFIVTGVFLVGFIGDPFFHKQLPLVLLSTVTGVVLAEHRSPWWRWPLRRPPEGREP